jgi:hypothetical protein
MRGLVQTRFAEVSASSFDVGAKARGSATRAVRNGTAMRDEYSFFDFHTFADELSISLEDSARIDRAQVFADMGRELMLAGSKRTSCAVRASLGGTIFACKLQNFRAMLSAIDEKEIVALTSQKSCRT